MIAYKFLGRNRVALYSGYEWPVDEWVEVDGHLAVCTNGIHACTRHELPMWIDDELWAIELDDVVDAGDVLVARRGRLQRRIEAWDDATACAFAESCIWRLRDQVVSALQLDGRDSDELARQEALDDLQRAALEAALAERAHDELLTLLADTVELLRGGRPDGYHAARSELPPRAGAIAANLGFVVAHAFGRAAVGASREEASYAAGFEAERRRQADWLGERLDLDA